MRATLPLLLAVLVPALAATPALAAAASEPARPAAGAPASAALTACDREARSAVFTGDMRALPGTDRMQMRFTLQVREGRGRWQRVQARRLDVWTTAAPGRTRYVFDKRVDNLAPGAYRVRVRFRWRDADGAVIRRAGRRSRACRVPDPRPDLTPRRIAFGRETASGRIYTVEVVNRGRSRAPAFRVGLQVGDVTLPDRRIRGLDAGERRRVRFEGPACAAGDPVVAAVDVGGDVDEAREGNDLLSVLCRLR